MSNYQGICLTSASWRFINVAIADAIEDLDQRVWETTARELQNLSAFFAPFLSVSSLGGMSLSKSDKGVEDAIKPQLLAKGWRRACDQITGNWEVPQAIGVCHPHSLPRAIRRVLPYWFERKRSQGPVPVHAVSVPVAAVLSWIAAGETRFPVRYIIASGTSQVAELSAVRASVTADVLHIHVDWTCELSPDEVPARRKDKLARLVRTLPVEPGAPAWRMACFSNLPWIAECLEGLPAAAAAHGFGLSSQARMHDDLDLARGAACAASLLESQAIPTAAFSRLNLADVCSRDIGMLCDNGRDGHFWHTLFPAGQPLSAASTELRIKGACPAAFHLFEYTGADHPPVWGSADDQFLKQVRWYGTGALTVPREIRPERLVIRIQTNPTADAIPQPRGEIRGAAENATPNDS